MSSCFDDNAIVALLEPDVPDHQRAVWMEHIDICAACRELVAEAVQLDHDGPRILVPGTTLERYVVLEMIGAGAMGVVYAAYDPQLGRKIALKLLRPDPGVSVAGATAGRERLLREAQALAKLSHPHVTAIHDVGTLDDEIFLAMELVEGTTLSAWREAAPRDVRAIVRVMRQVGEGLAAAHAVGLVHRDLKPDNILVDARERAWVTDFGLARSGTDGTGEVTLAAPSTDHELTTTGVLVGTPAYMAPEQVAGGAADPSTDQFAYCVTLYEALYGERPFDGLARGEVRPVPKQRRVPGWLRKIALRGLGDRATRFPSMTALLAALTKGPAISPRRIAVAVAMLAVIAGGMALATRGSEPATCTGAAAAWDGAWSADQQRAMYAAFARSGRDSAGAAAAQIDRLITDKAEAWRAMHTEACVATRVRGEASEAQLDRRIRCLGDRRNEVVALARLFAGADDAMVDRAVGAALALPSLADCANVRALATTPLPADPTVRAEIDRLGRVLADANVLEYTGKFVDGIALAQPALVAAKVAGYAPTIGKLELVIGRLALGARDFAVARSSLHEAAAIAQDTGDDAIAADAWTTLIRLVGFLENRPAEGRLWARYASGAIRRLGGDDEREATRLRMLATVVWRREAKLDEARDLIAKARVLFEHSHGPRYEIDLASCDEGLAGIEFDAGRPAEALVLHQHAAAVRVRLFGADHPSIATALVNEGEDLTKLGRATEAIPLIERAVEIVNAAHERGGDAYLEHRLAAAIRATGDFATALVHDERSLVSTTLAGEQNTDWEAWALTGQGLDLLGLGRAHEAIAPLEHAVSERVGHSLPAELAESQFALARALVHGDPRRAIQLATAARDRIASDADRFGGWYATLRDEIHTWLDARTVK